MYKTREILLPDWPTATTTCIVCGEKIKYYKYYLDKHGNRGERRPAPRYHNGRCRDIACTKRWKNQIKRQEQRKES